MKKVIVIGGGASGIMAAIQAAGRNAEVTVLEQNSKPLKKLLLTGNGRCNLTNLHWDSEVIRSNEPQKAYSVINKFDHLNAISFFNDIGILTKDRNGWVYPLNDSAALVARILLHEADRLHVKVKTNQEVEAVQKDPLGKFKVITNDWKYECDSVIVCVGTKASAEESGCSVLQSIADQFKIHIYKFLPALTALKSNAKGIGKWSGVRTEGRISLFVNETEIVNKSGELQLREYGISGIPVFELSRYAVKALDQNKNVSLLIDFLPRIAKDALARLLELEKQKHPEKNNKLILYGILPEKLADHILSLGKSVNEIVENIKEYRLPITGYIGASKAQACFGGIDLNELSEELEALKCPGLFFAGEAVDVDGCCGGYNLQWAWSSGYAAGCAAAIK